MKKLVKYLRGYVRECVLGPLFKLTEAVLELFVPLVISQIIDIGIDGGDRKYIVGRCLILAAFALLGLACSLSAQYFAAKAACGFAVKVRHALFSHIQTLSYSEIDTLGTSGLITRMTSDVNQLQTGVNMLLRLFLRSPFIVFGAMIMAFTVDPGSAVVFAVAIPVLSVVVFGIIVITVPLYKKVQQRLDGVLRLTRENLSGARVIRAFRLEKQEKESFSFADEALNTAQKLVGRISSLMNPLTYIIVNAAVIILIRIGAVRVDTGIITQGALFALYNYMTQISVELIKLANLIVTLTRSAASAKRVSETLSFGGAEKPEAEYTPVPVKGEYAVVFDNVSLRYPGGGADALTDISFAVKRGETVGIIGGTGSGKTSLVNLIPGFYKASGGTVTVDGTPADGYSPAALRAKIGIVPQKAVLFKGTIRENMLWGDENAADDDIYAALDIAQAREIADGKPGGLDFMLEQGGRNLSGGQRQRLTVARALVRKPRILILDDSSSALDYATDAAMRSALKTLPADTTVFVISQRTSSVMHADRILVLDDGRLVGNGTHEVLLETCPVYREIHDSQFGKGDAE